MKISFYIFITFSISCFSQNKGIENWNSNEKAQYVNLLNLSKYIQGKEKHQISKDTLFDKYVFFDYVLKDTITERRERRFNVFDTLFYSFRKIIDSIGLEKLDAKPIRFYKDHEIYEPFKEDLAKESINEEKMNYKKDSNVFAYYKKEAPKSPLGTLLFDSESDKLMSWIMINQGGYKYFLTFNLF